MRMLGKLKVIYQLTIYLTIKRQIIIKLILNSLQILKAK